MIRLQRGVIQLLFLLLLLLLLPIRGTTGWILLSSSSSLATTRTVLRKRTKTLSLSHYHHHDYYYQRVGWNPFSSQPQQRIVLRQQQQPPPPNFVSSSFVSLSLSLSSSSSSSSNNEQQQQQQQQSSSSSLSRTLHTCRGRISGISVSEDGIYVIIQIPVDKDQILLLLSSSSSSSSSLSSLDNSTTKDDNYNDTTDTTATATTSTTSLSSFLPILVTNDSMDQQQRAVVSAEGLTLVQLLANVDMAGPILPPELLSQIIIQYYEHEQVDEEEVDEEEVIQKKFHQQYDNDNKRIDTNNDNDNANNNVVANDTTNTTTISTSNENTIRQEVLQSIQRQLYTIYKTNNIKIDKTENVDETAQSSSQPPPPQLRYTDEIKNGWIRSRIRLPITSLNEIIIRVSTEKNHDGSSDNDESSPRRIEYTLSCSIQQMDGMNMKRRSDSNQPITIPITNYPDIIENVSYNYNPIVTPAFLAIALSLRYKAPIQIQLLLKNNDTNTKTNMNTNENSNTTNQLVVSYLFNETELRQRYPLYKTVQELQIQTAGVDATIRRGYEYTKLEAAYRIAVERKDVVAAYKIQNQMTELTTQALRTNLPVQSDTDYSTME